MFQDSVLEPAWMRFTWLVEVGRSRLPLEYGFGQNVEAREDIEQPQRGGVLTRLRDVTHGYGDKTFVEDG